MIASTRMISAIMSIIMKMRMKDKACLLATAA